MHMHAEEPAYVHMFAGQLRQVAESVAPVTEEYFATGHEVHEF